MSYGNTPLNAYKLKRSSLPWNQGEWHKRASWEWDLRNNNPVLTIWCNNPKEAEKLNKRNKPLASTPISARMGPMDLYKFFILSRKISSTEKPLSVYMDFKGSVYRNDELVKGEKETKTRLTFGRNADGIIYIRATDMVEEGRDEPELLFTSNPWVLAAPENGEFSKSQDSTLEFQAYIEVIRDVYKHILVSHFVPEERKGAPRKEDKPKPKQDADSLDFDDPGW